ncbi:MAG TPA: hypothetical protein VEX69_01250 [Candidatus Limnocylindria bacterium]|nr:hypothetical protein [Candidatus Limnocylindria bacterium]
MNPHKSSMRLNQLTGSSVAVTITMEGLERYLNDVLRPQSKKRRERENS